MFDLVMKILFCCGISVARYYISSLDGQRHDWCKIVIKRNLACAWVFQCKSRRATARQFTGGEPAAVAGEIEAGTPLVILETALGGERFVEELEDEPLPRIGELLCPLNQDAVDPGRQFSKYRWKVQACREQDERQTG